MCIKDGLGPDVIVTGEMPQTDCSLQVSISVQPDYDKYQVIVDVYMSEYLFGNRRVGAVC